MHFINCHTIINPRRACARVTVLVLSVCVFSLFWHLAQSGVSLHRQRTSRRQRASHLHRLVNGDVYGSRILIATPTSLSHVRDVLLVCLSVRTRYSGSTRD